MVACVPAPSPFDHGQSAEQAALSGDIPRGNAIEVKETALLLPESVFGAENRITQVCLTSSGLYLMITTSSVIPWLLLFFPPSSDTKK